MPLRVKNATAYVGSTALSTEGFFAICQTPSEAIVRNQTAVTGPKKRPIFAVPYFWTANNAMITTIVIGTTYDATRVVATLSPSIALSTEIAGVIMPSP